MQNRKHDSRVKAPDTTTVIDAIEQVRRDIGVVELWACALGAFAQPAPDYEAGKYVAWLAGGRAER